MGRGDGVGVGEGLGVGVMTGAGVGTEVDSGVGEAAGVTEAGTDDDGNADGDVVGVPDAAAWSPCVGEGDAVLSPHPPRASSTASARATARPGRRGLIA